MYFEVHGDAVHGDEPLGQDEVGQEEMVLSPQLKMFAVKYNEGAVAVLENVFTSPDLW